jgi:hypothetical protein
MNGHGPDVAWAWASGAAIRATTTATTATSRPEVLFMDTSTCEGKDWVESDETNDRRSEVDGPTERHDIPAQIPVTLHTSIAPAVNDFSAGLS